jgi:hypothetical protein
MVISACAQHRYVRGHYYRPGTRIAIGYNAYYPYDPFYYPSWSYRPYYYRPSGLELRIEDIQSDYRDRIWSARHDDNLSKRERRIKIHQLKSERDEAIRNAERNYHRSY